jgi:hypothetical protein
MRITLATASSGGKRRAVKSRADEAAKGGNVSTPAIPALRRARVA